MVKIALVISAIDPLNGAGFTLDLRVVEDAGIKAVGVPTGLLPQSPEGVEEAFFFPSSWLEQALSSLLGLEISGLKASILGNFPEHILREVLGKVKGPRILDPILRAGGKRVEKGERLRKIIPLFNIITPNIPEAREILEEELPPQGLCEKLAEEFKVTVLLKGGHSPEKTDYLCYQEKTFIFPPPEIFPYEVHGTGCLLSSALLAFLLRGLRPQEAVTEARAYLYRHYRRAVSLGKGKKIFLKNT